MYGVKKEGRKKAVISIKYAIDTAAQIDMVYTKYGSNWVQQVIKVRFLDCWCGWKERFWILKALWIVWKDLFM